MSLSAGKNFLVTLLLVGSMAIAIPVFGEHKPQSLLPPGFGEPAKPPSEAQTDQDKKSSDSSGAKAETKPTNLLEDLKLNTPQTTTADKKEPIAPADTVESDALSNAAAAADAADVIPPPKYDLAPEQRRSLAQIGVIGPDADGLAPTAFGTVDGQALEQVMRRTRAPIASRWVSIVLRRALLSNVMTPAHVNGADWAAERAWMLLRMGESNAARMLISQVDNDNYTPKMTMIAMQSALANANMASLCPLVQQAVATSEEAAWQYSRAICASLSGESGSASSLLSEAEADTGVDGVDYRLAERVVGAGKNTRHAVVIEWGGVEALSAWRFGTATAMGIVIPAELYSTVRPNVRAWAAQAPMLALADRTDNADWAAALGVYSSSALVDFYSALADADEGAVTSPQALLRVAYGDSDMAKRSTALHSLWMGPDLDDVHHYARLILTARAATQIAVDSKISPDIDALTASMLSAGLDLQAQRWAHVANDGSDDAARRAWGLLAVGTPGTIVDISDQRLANYRRTGTLRSRYLVASLIGLGRIAPSDAARLGRDYNVAVDQASNWSRKIDAAAARGEAGTVALLAAAGMQSLRWSEIPPEHVLHIVRAFKAVGLEPEARMVAAEALTRA